MTRREIRFTPRNREVRQWKWRGRGVRDAERVMRFRPDAANDDVRSIVIRRQIRWQRRASIDDKNRQENGRRIRKNSRFQNCICRHRNDCGGGGSHGRASSEQRRSQSSPEQELMRFHRHCRFLQMSFNAGVRSKSFGETVSADTPGRTICSPPSRAKFVAYSLQNISSVAPALTA